MHEVKVKAPRACVEKSQSKQNHPLTLTSVIKKTVSTGAYILQQRVFHKQCHPFKNMTIRRHKASSHPNKYRFLFS